jgi:hypothetical protein
MSEHIQEITTSEHAEHISETRVTLTVLQRWIASRNIEILGFTEALLSNAIAHFKCSGARPKYVCFDRFR